MPTRPSSGTFSETKREVGLLRMMQAGVIRSDYATLMLAEGQCPPAGRSCLWGHGLEIQLQLKVGLTRHVSERPLRLYAF
jgi:hypothetical protein